MMSGFIPGPARPEQVHPASSRKITGEVNSRERAIAFPWREIPISRQMNNKD